MSIIETIKSNGGKAWVNALTHNLALSREYGGEAKIKARLMALVHEGVLVAYDDGRKVKMA